jgi:hypothetical protein
MKKKFSNSEFEQKNGPDRTSESSRACPCGASVKFGIAGSCINYPYQNKKYLTGGPEGDVR